MASIGFYGDYLMRRRRRSRALGWRELVSGAEEEVCKGEERWYRDLRFMAEE